MHFNDVRQHLDVAVAVQTEMRPSKSPFSVTRATAEQYREGFVDKYVFYPSRPSPSLLASKTLLPPKGVL